MNTEENQNQKTLKEQNDSKALEFISIINEKKSQIEKNKLDQAWKTNCKFTIPGIIFSNLRTINTLEDLQIVFAQIIKDRDSISKAGKELGINTNAESEYKFQSYTYSQWLNDFKNQAENITRKSELSKLEKALKTLQSKISEDKQNELEIEDLVKNLGL